MKKIVSLLNAHIVVPQLKCNQAMGPAGKQQQTYYLAKDGMLIL
jgi:hypothetical protein